MPTRAKDPAERMLAATLMAGECLNDAKAPFSARWRVQSQDGTEMTFSEPTGNRLLTRGLIARHPDESDNQNSTTRFVAVPETGASIAIQLVQRRPGRRTNRPMKQPPKREMVDLLNDIGMKMAGTVGSFDSGIPAEVRAKLRTEIYQPVVDMLLRTGSWPIDPWTTAVRYGIRAP